ncbi:ATP synthase F0 sector subunit a, partial [hydrothermal vent metagenome]
MAEHAKQAAPAAVEAEPAVAQGAEGGSGINPMEQFEIKRLADWNIGGLDVSFTNASLWMVIGVCVASLVVLAGSSKLVPGRMQSIGELIYEFISGMMRDILGDSGRSFFPLIFTLFMFVLSANMLGMIPYSFTTTSQIIVTFGLAAF